VDSVTTKHKIPGVFLILTLLAVSCGESEKRLSPVSYADFERYIQATHYVTDAEKFGWSIVQTDVFNFKRVDGANWRIPNGKDSVRIKELPVTQVSYNDAMAYCEWAQQRLPTYDEYWELVEKDGRRVVSNNEYPISSVHEVNVVGNVWDITFGESPSQVRLAGGSLFCSPETCHGTVRERRLIVDRETANIHIGFAVVDQ
jgi:hypothetical protein